MVRDDYKNDTININKLMSYHHVVVLLTARWIGRLFEVSSVFVFRIQIIDEIDNGCVVSGRHEHYSIGHTSSL